MNSDMMSMGTGKMMVELFSAEMLFRVCKYRSWNKAIILKTEIKIFSPVELPDCP